MVLYKDMEETFYKILKKEHEFNSRGWPFLIKVRDVHDKTMIDATFKHRVNGTEDFDLVIQAKTAVLHIDLKAKQVKVYLDDAEIQRYRREADVMLINDRILVIPIPKDSKFNVDPKIQEFTNVELMQHLRDERRTLATERYRAALTAGFQFGTGRVERLNWYTVREAFVNHGYRTRNCNELETEWWQRLSMACGSLLFVVLGAPIGIRFARRDFLSAFMTCFLPIITLYYPLMLFGVNMSKEGIGIWILAPYLSLWIGNVILAILAGLVLPPVIRH
jgi:lipopolysaccharide export system permease protein